MDGILLLNKPKGMTSHDCVFKVRKLVKMKKVGHTGTLDPDVSGVLPVCLGRATKIVEYVTAANKTYEGEVTLGFSTTTEDASGEIVGEKRVDREIMKEEVVNVLHSLTGEIIQTPPMYSAVKVNGKRLYEYARKGIVIDRPSRNITIHKLELISDINQNDQTVSFRFRVTCSKGTYVRTLAVQMGEKLGYPSHMSDLRRTSSGEFTLEQCITLDELEHIVKTGTIQEHLLSIEGALSHLLKFTINDKVAEKVKNGSVLPVPEELHDLRIGEPIAILHDEKILAIYQRHPDKPQLIKPIKVLVNNQELQ
ncbi:tRNA pseudouridine(55) synthase TruB [Bacillus timonensis]|uniref:tRNA pseudouridine(55) synthase TruB n=1 Tax=Bacillus timonensis TaxID=1033734 RepID=UPI000287AF1E|nr:tRNA pseudouridine(55) synthase TruB [Bacillus timonensis]